MKTRYQAACNLCRYTTALEKCENFRTKLHGAIKKGKSIEAERNELQERLDASEAAAAEAAAAEAAAVGSSTSTSLADPEATAAAAVRATKAGLYTLPVDP